MNIVSKGERQMNSHLFERKTFLDNSWMKADTENIFTIENYLDFKLIRVHLLRATANESEALKKYLTRLQNIESDKFIFDLSESTFIDSTFLSNLISFNKSNNGKIKLIVSDKRQLTIFRITKIDSLFDIYSSLDKAVLN